MTADPVELPDDAVDGPVWSTVCDLADGFSGTWVLIGARMVELHGLAAGRRPPRRSADVDTLFDARAMGSRPADAADWLRANGFAMDGISTDGIGHRFVRNGVYVDVLAPDHLGSPATLDVGEGSRTIAVPAGRRVLNHSSSLEVACGGRRATIPIPTLAGALIAKSAAVTVDDTPQNQRIDLAFLYSLIADPEAVRTELGAAGRKVLAKRNELADRRHEAWLHLGEFATDGYDAFTYIAGS